MDEVCVGHNFSLAYREVLLHLDEMNTCVCVTCKCAFIYANVLSLASLSFWNILTQNYATLYYCTRMQHLRILTCFNKSIQYFNVSCICDIFGRLLLHPA